MVPEPSRAHDAAVPHVAPTAGLAAAAPVDGTTTSLDPVWRRAGHDHGQLRTGAGAILTIGSQGPLDAQGRLLHEGDMAAQLALALVNLTEVVLAAGVGLSDLAHLRIHTTDIASLIEVQFVVSEHLAEQGATPPISIVEVSRLAVPGMELEIDGLAVAPPNHRPEPT